jgi:hypothetical protein
MAGSFLKRLRSKIAARVPAPTANAVQLLLPPATAFGDLLDITQRPDTLDRESEELGKLIDQHR